MSVMTGVGIVLVFLGLNSISETDGWGPKDVVALVTAVLGLLFVFRGLL